MMLNIVNRCWNGILALKLGTVRFTVLRTKRKIVCSLAITEAVKIQAWSAS
jgi:hypothetical protein